MNGNNQENNYPWRSYTKGLLALAATVSAYCLGKNLGLLCWQQHAENSSLLAPHEFDQVTAAFIASDPTGQAISTQQELAEFNQFAINRQLLFEEKPLSINSDTKQLDELNQKDNQFLVHGLYTFVKTIGLAGDDRAKSIREISDGNVIIMGDTLQGNHTDILISLLRADGVIPWSKTFGGSGDDHVHSFIETRLGDLVLVGSTKGVSGAENDVLIAKFDKAGNEIWQRTFAGPGNDQGFDLVETAEGNIRLIGSTNNPENGLLNILLDAEGNLQSTASRFITGITEHQARSIVDTGGGFFISGWTSSGSPSYNALIIGLTADGFLAFSKSFGGNGDDRILSLQKTADNGLIVAGFTTRTIDASDVLSDAFVAKLNSNTFTVDIDWIKAIGVVNRTDLAADIKETPNGNFIAVGYTDSPDGEHGLLVKLDQDGNRLWSIGLSEGALSGGGASDDLAAIELSRKGEMYVAGLTHSADPHSAEMFISKLTLNGEIAGCDNWLRNLPLNETSLSSDDWIVQDADLFDKGMPSSFTLLNATLVLTDVSSNATASRPCGGIVISPSPSVSVNVTQSPSTQHSPSPSLSPQATSSSSITISLSAEPSMTPSNSPSLRINQAPTITLATGSIVYHAEENPVVVDRMLEITDDENYLQSAKVFISDGFTRHTDELAIAIPINQKPGWRYEASQGILLINQTASVAEYQAALRALTYRNMLKDPVSHERKIKFQICDSELLCAEAVKTIVITDDPNENGPSTLIIAFSTAVPILFLVFVAGMCYLAKLRNQVGPGMSMSLGFFSGSIGQLNTGSVVSRETHADTVNVERDFNNGTQIRF